MYVTVGLVPFACNVTAGDTYHGHDRVGHNGGVFAGHQERHGVAQADRYHAYAHRVALLYVTGWVG